ncbi:hypothetical protein GCM10027164_29060 [Algoriphagus taiwanensis]|uniref:Concanavalin A-like lectin/glucanase superfamily protein n=1 Tax=Algoriphagus taiwanensis TaxID=1445656 RepID=A0ABQ6Q7D6_9BACT|nr:hypothetical protein Ataiwa_38530 [Algoriphagus taiwanensis]
MKEPNLNISIKIESDDSSPIQIKSLLINGEEFVKKNDKSNSDSKDSDLSKEDVLPLTAATLIGQKEERIVTPSAEISPKVPLPANSNSLEQYGGDSFHKMFFGDLTYEPIGSGRSRVTYQGAENVFTSDFVGKWLEPSRVHKCSIEFPEEGINYLPGSLSSIYSRVIEVENGKNLIVDFEYNGGDFLNPKRVINQDGIFFFDNRMAFETWSRASNRGDALFAESGKIYAVLGFPKIEVVSDSALHFTWSGEGERPAIHLMFSDSFIGDRHGRGDNKPLSFSRTFGGNTSFFHLPSEGRVDIDFDWQFLPSTYSHSVVQYGSPNGSIFLDGSPLSKQYGLKRFSNFDQFRIKRLMEQKLGFVRPGAVFSMPSQGYCNGGGVHDGRDITGFCTYRFEGDWVSKDPNNMKARTSGGLAVEWVGHSAESPGKFIELESAKPSKFSGLKFRFNNKTELEVLHPDFTWYHLASQEWTGGTSTGSEFTSVKIDGIPIGLNTNGDFWLVFGEENTQARNLSARTLNLFDRIPAQGDVIACNTGNLRDLNIIGKPSPSQLEVWGWCIQEGDVFESEGKTCRVKKAERKWKTWGQLSNSLPLAQIPKREDRRVTFTEITIDQELAQPITQVKLKVISSRTAKLLDGNYREEGEAYWGLGNEAPGHLMYTDYNVNLLIKNAQISGLIRSTSRPLWAETKAEISGNVNSLQLIPIQEKLWSAGDQIFLLSPDGKKIEKLEVSMSYQPGSDRLSVISKELSSSFPQGSVVCSLFSLCGKAEFDHVYFIKENGEISYSNRIDYRPQGLRLRQLIQKKEDCRVKIIGGRMSWYSNLDNRFEPEIELTQTPHLVSPTGSRPILLNPKISDGKGAVFGHQSKEVDKEEIYVSYYILARQDEVDLSNSELGADLYLCGNGKFYLNKLRTKNFIDKGKDTGVGFNLVFEERFDYSNSLLVIGKEGKAGLMIASPFKIGTLQIDLAQWELKPGLFNGGGFQTRQDSSSPDYAKYIQINK